MNHQIILHKQTDKFGKSIIVSTDKELIAHVLSDGSIHVLTEAPILPYVMKDLIVLSENFILFWNNLKEETHVS